MEDFLSDLAIAMIAVLAAKALDELIEFIKEKRTPRISARGVLLKGSQQFGWLPTARKL